VLEKYGADIRPFFESPKAANDFKKYLVNLLQAVDSIHSVGIIKATQFMNYYLGQLLVPYFIFISHSGMVILSLKIYCVDML